MISRRWWKILREMEKIVRLKLLMKNLLTSFIVWSKLGSKINLLLLILKSHSFRISTVCTSFLKKTQMMKERSRENFTEDSEKLMNLISTMNMDLLSRLILKFSSKASWKSKRIVGIRIRKARKRMQIKRIWKWRSYIDWNLSPFF